MHRRVPHMEGAGVESSGRERQKAEPNQVGIEPTVTGRRSSSKHELADCNKRQTEARCLAGAPAVQHLTKRQCGRECQRGSHREHQSKPDLCKNTDECVCARAHARA